MTTTCVKGKDGRAALIGMVHLPPLPGSASWSGDIDAVLKWAERDAAVLVEGGVDALLVENMGDVPYLKGNVGPETVAAVSLAVDRVKRFGLPVGVQVLAAANRQALGVAVAAGCAFIRVEGFAYAHVADEGWIDASAGDLVRARARLLAGVGERRVEIWADVQKKHAAHAVTADLDVAALSRGAAFCGADALVITGQETGAAARVSDIEEAKASGLPVVVGSGVTAQTAGMFGQLAQALIVGTATKTGGVWRNPVALERVAEIRKAMG